MERLTGSHPMALRYTDSNGNAARVCVGRDTVYIDGVMYTTEFLAGLAALSRSEHAMYECVWADCPDHACPYDHSHTQNFCGRPTCRVS